MLPGSIVILSEAYPFALRINPKSLIILSGACRFARESTGVVEGPLPCLGSRCRRKAFPLQPYFSLLAFPSITVVQVFPSCDMSNLKV